MNILHINYSDFSGGSAIACSRLHSALLKKNINSWMAVCNSNFKQKNILTFSNKKNKFEYLLKKNTSRLILKFFENKNKVDYSISFFNNPIFKEILGLEFDIINFHWIGNETLSLKQLSSFKKPKIWTLLDMWPFLGAEHINYSYKSKFDYWNNSEILDKQFFEINKWMLKRKMKYYDSNIKLVSISRWLANKASESLLFRDKEIDVIPCTLDFEIWRPLERTIARKILNIENKKTILFSSSGGTWNYNKGFNLLVEALKNFKNLKDIHLVILGKLKKSDLKNLEISFTEIPKVFFGDVANLINIYSSVDLVVIPSLIEAFGQVALEAASCNVPTVAFKNTGVTEIIEHKKNGYLAEFNNSEDLFNGINWCLEDYNLQLLKNNSREIALKKFSNDLIVKKYQKIYEDIL
tara:strand:- start:602 stop:1828 length:1227 start_codon:yes stop_codon:yes gene_type:complete